MHLLRGSTGLQRHAWTGERLASPSPHARRPARAAVAARSGGTAGSATADKAGMPQQASAQGSIDVSTDPAGLVESNQEQALLQCSSAYWELLNNPNIDTVTQRAKSASDAGMLRRKGHLKEQDHFIEFMRNMHETHTCEEAMAKMERWISEHRQDPRRSRLRRLCPTIGSFFTPLRLVDAFKEYDASFYLSRRKYIPPNFAELRHILNIAQIHASADTLKLITFDADGTLYADGAHIEQDSVMISLIIMLLRSNVHVAIVTAAGYPGDASKFEQRIAGLLQAFVRYKLPASITNRFHLMGGECNYLLRVNPGTQHLEFVPDEEWRTPEMLSWKDEDIQALLDGAQVVLTEGAARLCMPVEVIRKTRAVGVVPTAPTIYEVLEELAITVQAQLLAKVPFCAFNGGNDVFVDVGNKSLGLDAMMKHLGCAPHEVLHVGDRFTASGNDAATRDCCSIVWVANAEETHFFVRLLLQDIRAHRCQPYIE